MVNEDGVRLHPAGDTPRAYARDARDKQEHDMNRDRLAGTWKQVGGKITEHWGRFTRDLQRESAGRRAQLEGRLQARYGSEKDAAARQLGEFMNRNRNWLTSGR